MNQSVSHPLRFASANVRSIHSTRGVQEALDLMGREPWGVLVIAAAVGHDVGAISAAAMAECPGARVLAASCAGVVGREGAGQSLHDLAVMGIRGDGFTVASTEPLFGANSFEQGVVLARQLQGTPHPVRMVFLIASGIDIANDRLIEGIESVLGPDVVIFGATSSDQMQGIATFQAVDGVKSQHAAFAVGIWDPTLEVETAATHGFVAEGEPMVVTAAAGNRIAELDGRPAWTVFLERLGLPATAREGDTIPIGALAEPLPDALATEYGNGHLLRVVTHHTERGELVYATTAAAGQRLWLTRRDEALIFSEMSRMTAAMTARRPGQTPVAVFHSDCLARGRMLFNRVMKEELVQRMQEPFVGQGVVPPWLGLYGFGEYARLGGRNTYHNYTTALAAIYRVASPSSYA